MGQQVAGLLLAAGAGTRMGMPKGLIEFEGEPLVERGARMLIDGGCDPVVVVVGSRADDVVAALHAPVVAVRNDHWPSGMGSSLRLGLAVLPDDVSAVAIALVDQPAVTAEAIRRLVEAWRDGAVAAVAMYEGQQRNPVVLDRSVWEGVAETAVGDVGAREFLRAKPSLVTPVACEDVAGPQDLDTPGDLAEARRTAAVRPE